MGWSPDHSAQDSPVMSIFIQLYKTHYSPPVLGFCIFHFPYCQWPIGAKHFQFHISRLVMSYWLLAGLEWPGPWRRKGPQQICLITALFTSMKCLQPMWFEEFFNFLVAFGDIIWPPAVGSGHHPSGLAKYCSQLMPQPWIWNWYTPGCSHDETTQGTPLPTANQLD